MIPDQPILRRAPKFSLFTDSRYDPFYLISKNANRIRDFPTSDTLSNLNFHLTDVHERTHWFQQVGTTYGAFLHALKSSQSQTFLRFLREEPRQKRAEIVRARMEKGEPFINLKPTSQYLHLEEQDENSDIGVLKQIWFDHQWMYASFDDSSSTDGLGHPPTEAGGHVMADVILHCCDTWGFMSPDYEVSGHPGARDWYFADDENFVEMLLNLNGEKKHLTTVSLMECGASLNELQQFQHGLMQPLLGSEYDLEFQKFFQYFLNSSYSIPFKIFTSVTKKHAIDIHTAPLSLNLLIFFALNPPLPPRSLSKPKRPYRWEEVYPPIRFMIGLKYIDRITKIEDPQSIEAMQLFIKELQEETGLPYSGDCPLPDRKPGIDEAYHQAHQSEVSFVIDDDLVLDSQTNLLGMADNLPLLANFSSCISGELSKQFVDRLIRVDEKFDFMSAPLEFSKNGKIAFRGTADFGNNIVRSVAISNSLYDFVCGSGALSLDMLPGEVANSSSMHRLVKNTIERLIVETDNVN